VVYDSAVLLARLSEADAEEVVLLSEKLEM